jgi:predicted ATP-binding protein involved in virulence
MKLESITLKNYRLFSDLTCTLHPELTVIVANNGGGKTSLLDAIRVAFGTYLSAFPAGKGIGIKIPDVRKEKTKEELLIMAQVFPAEILASGKLTGSDKVTSWSRALNTSKSGTTIKDARELKELGDKLLQTGTDTSDQTNWPLLAYYGTGRLWSQKKLTTGKMFSSGFNSRSAGYMDCMEPASSSKYFEEWFGYAYRAITQSKIRFMEANPNATPQEVIAHQSAYSPLVSAVQEAVDIVLAPSGWRSLWYSETEKEVVAVHDQFGRLTVGQLSDGIRNSLGLVSDIAFRAVQLNPHLGSKAAKETRGIVLIDEVDMHLHPSWQQTILTNLRDAFPQIQFIVTTHSPQVLSTVRRENIRVIGLDTSGKLIAEPPLAMTYGEPSGDVMYSVMMVDPQPPISEKVDLQRLTEWIDQGNYESVAVKELMQKLTAVLGEQHPQLQRLRRSINRQETLKV